LEQGICEEQNILISEWLSASLEARKAAQRLRAASGRRLEYKVCEELLYQARDAAKRRRLSASSSIAGSTGAF
jgi:hypothetical protein